MSNNFSNLGIDKKIQDMLSKNRIEMPTPIQTKVIPQILRGKDVIAQAQTGTGKTLAFLLPIMEKIDNEKPYIQSLIITPTRELAIQITQEAKNIASLKEINVLAAYGGQDVDSQINKLKGNIHMVIATPGRLLDHLDRNTISFGKISMLVLDEADQMLKMGFLGEVEKIISQVPKKRQTMFFSATIPTQIRHLTKKYMKEPVDIRIESKNITIDEIKQLVVETTDRRKQDSLCKYLDECNPFLAIIFCRTKRRVDTLCDALEQKGYNCAKLHGDLSQTKREKVMKDCKKAKIQYLIATDVASRGIDIDGITHIFNYDIPEDAESYIHRIGRTGRAGKSGMAVTFVAPKDMEDLRDIEKGIRMSLKRVLLTKEDFKEDANDTKINVKAKDHSNSKKDFKDSFRKNKDFSKNDANKKKKYRKKSIKKS